MNKLKNIALFIDADNISGNHYKYIHNILSQEGRIICNRIYGDFSKTSTSSNWEKIIFEYGMEAIQVFRIPKKESTDNSLIVDCMKILYNLSSIDIFVIISSDSDFSSLATEIRLKSKFIIGVGYSHTSLKLRNNCDKFIIIENIHDNCISNQTTEKLGENEKFEKLKRIEKFKPFINEMFTIINKKFIHINDFFKFITTNKLNNILLKIKNAADFQNACISIPYLLFKNNVLYDIRIGNNNQTIINVLEQMLDDCDREEILMSYIKSIMINTDKSFHQKNYGINRMIDFCKTFIINSNIEYNVSKHNEYVIKIHNFSNPLLDCEVSSQYTASLGDNEFNNLSTTSSSPSSIYEVKAPCLSIENSESSSDDTEENFILQEHTNEMTFIKEIMGDNNNQINNFNKKLVNFELNFGNNNNQDE